MGLRILVSSTLFNHLKIDQVSDSCRKKVKGPEGGGGETIRESGNSDSKGEASRPNPWDVRIAFSSSYKNQKKDVR